MSRTASTALTVEGDLLCTHTLAQAPRKGAPLLLEFPVNPEMGPFLVSATTSWLWVMPSSKGTIRAAFQRKEDYQVLGTLVSAVIKEGRRAEWGNIQPLSGEGLLLAMAHLRAYELTELEVLAHPEFDWTKMEVQPVVTETEGEEHRTILGAPLCHASWMTTDMVVVAPQDKNFLGFMVNHKVGNNSLWLSVVHNAPRGLAVCVG